MKYLRLTLDLLKKAVGFVTRFLPASFERLFFDGFGHFHIVFYPALFYMIYDTVNEDGLLIYQQEFI